MKMQRRRYEMVLEAELPIAHHEGTIGNMSHIMRRKIRHAGGWANVPIITADTMRHGMREAAAYALLDAAGLLEEPKLSEAALRLLFAGGMVTGRGEASNIKLDQYREMCELVPSMTLFGGCADNRVIPGQLTVEDATLVCEETGRYVPEWSHKTVAELSGIDGGRSYVEEVQRVRMDPTLQPQKTRLLTSNEQVKVAGRLKASESNSADDGASKKEKSSMMPRSMERICQGSMFHWACQAIVYDELQLDTFHVALGQFLANCWVGGKRGTGHGKMRPVAGQQSSMQAFSAPIEDVDMKALVGPEATGVGSRFREHVAERSERIATFLAGVNA